MSGLEWNDLTLWPCELVDLLHTCREEWKIVLPSGVRCKGSTFADEGTLRCLRLPDHTGPCCNFKCRLEEYVDRYYRKVVYEVYSWTGPTLLLYGELENPDAK